MLTTKELKRSLTFLIALICVFFFQKQVCKWDAWLKPCAMCQHTARSKSTSVFVSLSFFSYLSPPSAFNANKKHQWKDESNQIGDQDQFSHFYKRDRKRTVNTWASDFLTHWKPVAFSTVADSVDHRSAIHRRSVYAYEYKYIFFKHNHFCLLCHWGLGPLKCFISLINENFFCFWFFFGQCFHLPVFSPSLKLHTIPNFLAGSFAAHPGDHLWSWDHLRSNLGIICGRGSFAVSGSFAALYSFPW